MAFSVRSADATASEARSNDKPVWPLRGTNQDIRTSHKAIWYKSSQLALNWLKVCREIMYGNRGCKKECSQLCLGAGHGHQRFL